MNQEEKLYNKKYKPFYHNLTNYFNSFVIPDAMAFYIASSYEYNIIDNFSLENHLNSGLDIFNINYDIERLIPLISHILLIKYNLKIVKTNPLILKKNI